MSINKPNISTVVKYVVERFGAIVSGDIEATWNSLNNTLTAKIDSGSFRGDEAIDIIMSIKIEHDGGIVYVDASAILMPYWSQVTAYVVPADIKDVEKHQVVKEAYFVLKTLEEIDDQLNFDNISQLVLTSIGYSEVIGLHTFFDIDNSNVIIGFDSAIYNNTECLNISFEINFSNNNIDYQSDPIIEYAFQMAIFSMQQLHENNTPVYLKSLIDNVFVDVNSLVNLDVSANFNDADIGDQLRYSALLENGSNLPDWLTIDQSTGVFQGVPTNDDVGIINITVTAKDGANATVSDTYTLTVNNIPTVLTAINDASTNEDATYSYDTSVNFVDVDAGDSITYSATLEIGTTLPTWLSINITTGVLSGTPLDADVGAIDIKVTATDTSGASVSDSYTLTVNNTNDVPILVSDLPVLEVNEDSVFTYDLSSHFYDVDTDDVLNYSLTYSRYSSMETRSDGYSTSSGSWYPESWVQIDSETGMLSVNPIDANVGIYKIGIDIDDGESNITDYLYLRVNEVNDIPELTGNFIGSVLSGTNIITTGEVVGSDIDGPMPYFDQTIDMNFNNAWTAISKEINGLLGHIVMIENVWGDYIVIESNEDWIDLNYWDFQFIPDNYSLTTSDGFWEDVRTVVSENATTTTISNSLGDHSVGIIYEDGSYNVEQTIASSLAWFEPFDLNIIYDILQNTRLIFGNTVIKETGSVINFNYTENYNNIGDVMFISGDITVDGIPVEDINNNQFVNPEFTSIGVLTTSTEYGIDSVLSLGDSLLYQIQDQQGIYGSLKLDEQHNWIYTLDENDPDTIALTSEQTATDSFVITLSDGIDIVTQQIDITVAGGDASLMNVVIYITDNKLLDSISLNYFKDGLDTGISTLVEAGDITFPDTSLVFDVVKLSDSAAYNDTSSIQADDAVAILRDIVFLDELVIGSAAWHAADVNNDGRIAADDAVAVLRHIVLLDNIDTFDLIDNTTGNRITNLDANAIDVGQWTIVANGDVDQSGGFGDAYVMQVDIV
jgi:VCBS repeat-containing protein